jgi:hypothetical protein
MAVDVSRIDFRVGLITKAERHPEADKLYVEQGIGAYESSLYYCMMCP